MCATTALAHRHVSSASLASDSSGCSTPPSRNQSCALRGNQEQHAVPACMCVCSLVAVREPSSLLYRRNKLFLFGR